MLLLVAWRNIWRNKTRSLVILVAVCLGLTAGVFYVAFYNGMVIQRIDAAIKTEVSHLQVHHKEYLTNPDKKFTVPESDIVLENIMNTPGVKAVSDRSIVATMIQSTTTSTGVKIAGINPDKEKIVTNLSEKILEGSYFENGKRNPIVIGKKLADKLKVTLRSKVVVTLQDMEGNITGASFRVEGIYETSNSMYDEMSVFVKKSDLAKLLIMEENSCHEIAVLLNDNKYLPLVTSSLQKQFPQLDIKSWREIMPEVGLVESSMDFTMYIFIIIILLALLFGIINTMLMAVLERTKELGMLMAIGMNKTRVFLMITLETVMLSLTGGMLGIIFGWLLVIWYGSHGVDLSTWSAAYKAMGYDTLIYTKLTLDESVKITIMVILTGIIASIYPARKALKLKPAEAIRIDM